MSLPDEMPLGENVLASIRMDRVLSQRLSIQLLLTYGKLNTFPLSPCYGWKEANFLTLLGLKAGCFNRVLLHLKSNAGKNNYINKSEGPGVDKMITII